MHHVEAQESGKNVFLNNGKNQTTSEAIFGSKPIADL
jgi:hypothetical protein